MLRRIALLIGALGAIALTGCASTTSAADSCTKYRDHIIDLRLEQAPTPDMTDKQRDAELDKHRAVLMGVMGERLVAECKNRNQAQIACVLAAEDTADAHKCTGQTPSRRTAPTRTATKSTKTTSTKNTSTRNTSTKAGGKR